MAFKRTFSAEQLKLNGLLLTGSSDGLYFNGGLVGATSGVNIGGGAGEIISGKIDSDLQVRTIKAGSNISVTTSDNEITIASTIPASQTADIAALKAASGYLHTSVQLISGDLDTAEVGITNLNTATGYINSEVTVMSGSVQLISGLANTNSTAINTNETNITTLNTATGHITTNQTELQTATGWLHDSHRTLSGRVDVHDTEITTLEDGLASATGSLGLVSGRVDNHNQGLTDLSGNLHTTGQTLQSTINTLSGDAVLKYSDQLITDDKHFQDRLYVKELIVTGSMSTVDTTNISTSDNIITINTGEGVFPSGVDLIYAGLDVMRHTGSGQFIYPHAMLVFNEGRFREGLASSSDGKSYEAGINKKGWQIGITGTGHGSVFYDIATTDLTDDLSTNIGLVSGELVKTGISLDGRIDTLESSSSTHTSQISDLNTATGALSTATGVISTATGELHTWVKVVSGTADSAVPNTTQVVAGVGLAGGGALSSNITINAGIGSGLYGTADDINISGEGVTNLMLAGGITDDKLNKITATDKVGGEAIDISSATDGTSITVDDDDNLLIDDGGITKRIKVSQLVQGIETGKADGSTIGVVTFDSTNFSDNGVGLITSNAITIHPDGGLTGDSSVNLGGTLKIGANVDDTTIEINTDKLKVKDGSIGNTQIGFGYAGSDTKSGAANSTKGTLSQGLSTPGINAFSFNGSSSTTVSVDSTVVRTFGDQDIHGWKKFHGDVLINNLNVTGTFTRIDVNNVTIEDNIILINSGEAGAGVTLGTAGLDVDRGSQAHAYLLFDETAPTRDGSLSQKWVAGITGSPYGIHPIITEREFETKKVSIPNGADHIGISYANSYGSTVPNVVASISNTGHLEDFVGHQISGMSNTGCWIQLTEQVSSEYYQATVFVSVV